MQLRDALHDYKRASGDETLFAGERRTLSGRFSGGDRRLVHIDDGVLRDFGYPLSGLTGLVRSRFGLKVDGEKHWFDDEASTRVGRWERVQSSWSVSVFRVTSETVVMRVRTPIGRERFYGAAWMDLEDRLPELDDTPAWERRARDCRP